MDTLKTASSVPKTSEETPAAAATENGKRPEAPTTTEQLVKQVVAGETPQKESSLVSNTGSSKKLDKKQV